MAAVPPHPSTVHDAAAGGYAAQHAAQANVQSLNQSAEFFLSNYRLGRTLGIGSFGKVKVAEHILTGHKVAIKILNRRKIQAMDMEEKVRREIKILRLFMHPHIIRLYEVIETATDIYVVMEYVKGGELFDHIVEKGRLPEDEARHFFQQIISGVEYCHRNMVVHRDLKPENLLLDSRLAVKIADFGLSNVMRDGHFLKTSCGSPNYAAPEVISGKLYAGPEVDVWSCGVILYALLCGSLPFDDENIPNLFKKIKGGIYNLPSHLSPGARDLIPRMLLVDPLKRITIPEVRCHPWFTEHLPRYLAVMQADTAVTSPRLDEEMISEVVRLGFDREHLVSSIRTRQQNKATVTYWLLLDNRRRMPSSGYLSAELSEAAAAAAHQAAMAGHNQQQQQGYPGQQGGTGHPSYPGGSRAQHGGLGHQHSGEGHGLPQQRLVAERKWRLGWHARGHPSALMAELYRVLQANQVTWKKLGPYNLKCRKVVHLRPLAAGSQQQQQQQPNQQQLQQQLDSNSSNEPVAMDTSCTGGGETTASGASNAAAAAMDAQNGPEAMQHDSGPQQQQQQQQGRDDAGMSAQSTARPGLVLHNINTGVSSSGNHSTGAQAGGYAEHVLKFETQMYKIRDDEYAIDVQRLDGELLMFMDVCGRLLGDIRA